MGVLSRPEMSFMSGEDGPQFIDTNILVYAHDVTAGVKYERARDLIQRLWLTRQGCLSIQVLQEFYAVVTRKKSDSLTPGVAARIISKLAEWDVHRPAVDSILSAIRIQNRHHISFWDALIIQSACELGCTTIWSEDLSPGQSYDSVTVINPFLWAGPFA